MNLIYVEEWCEDTECENYSETVLLQSGDEWGTSYCAECGERELKRS